MTKKIYSHLSLITVLAFTPLFVKAQLPGVKAGIQKVSENEVLVYLLPDDDFDGVVGNATVTVRYATDPGVVLGSPQIVASEWPSGTALSDFGTYTDGGFTYRSFYYDNPGLAYLSTEGLGWTGNAPVNFFTIPVTVPEGECSTLELTDNAFQDGINIEWFISLNGIEATD